MPMREKAIPVPSGSICELANAAQMRQIASQTAGPLQRGVVHGAAEARNGAADAWDASTRKSPSTLGAATRTSGKG